MSRFVGFFRGDRLSLYRIEQDPLMLHEETPYPPQWSDVKLLGSCRSTLCIYNGVTREVALWDPFANNGHRVLPAADPRRPPELDLSFDSFNSDRRKLPEPVVSAYVFGFDERNAKYVLLRVVQNLPRSNFAEVSIYRERDNMWRPLQRRLEWSYFLVESARMGVFLRDRLYWLMRCGPVRDSAMVLLAFDISTNSFVDMDLPDNINHNHRMDLARLGGHLCLIIYGQNRRVDVIIKKYNGLEQPWEPLFSLNAQGELQGEFQSVQPLAYFQNDLNRVLVELGINKKKTLACYNLVTEQLQLDVMPWSFDKATYLLFGF